MPFFRGIGEVPSLKRHILSVVFVRRAAMARTRPSADAIVTNSRQIELLYGP